MRIGLLGIISRMAPATPVNFATWLYTYAQMATKYAKPAVFQSLLLTLVLAGVARSQPPALSVGQTINLTSTMEAAGNTLFSLNSLGLLRSGRLTLQGTYSASGWSYSLVGPSMTTAYTGNISSGTAGSTDVVVAFTGSGSADSHAFSSNGTTTWKIAGGATAGGNYVSLEHLESGTGSHWLLAAVEALGGGIVGGLVSGGVGAVAGAGLALAASQVGVASTTAPPTPTLPPLPGVMPISAQALQIGNDQSLVVINPQSATVTMNVANIVSINASFAGGTISGTVDIVQTAPQACAANITNPLQALAGTWSFSMDGTALSTQPFASAGRFVAGIGKDLVGNPIGLLTITNTSGSVRQETDTGRYSINSDCSGGTLTFNLSSHPVTLDFWFVNGGGELFFANTNPGDIIRGAGKRGDCIIGCICNNPVGCPCCSFIFLPLSTSLF